MSFGQTQATGTGRWLKRAFLAVTTALTLSTPAIAQINNNVESANSSLPYCIMWTPGDRTPKEIKDSPYYGQFLENYVDATHVMLGKYIDATECKDKPFMISIVNNSKENVIQVCSCEIDGAGHTTTTCVTSSRALVYEDGKDCYLALGFYPNTKSPEKFVILTTNEGPNVLLDQIRRDCSSFYKRCIKHTSNKKDFFKIIEAASLKK